MTPRADSGIAETVCDVLIIDDESTLSEVIKEGLEIMHGFRVSTVGDAEAGLARIQTRITDVLLLDIVLPGMDGFELLGMLKPFGKVTRPRTVVVMSALTDRDTNQRLTDLGVISVLPKPFTLNELLKVVSA
jgi:DNA-binding response OmpR family regulator